MGTWFYVLVWIGIAGIASGLIKSNDKFFLNYFVPILILTCLAISLTPILLILSFFGSSTAYETAQRIANITAPLYGLEPNLHTMSAMVFWFGGGMYMVIISGAVGWFVAIKEFRKRRRI